MKPLEALHARNAKKNWAAEIKRMAIEILFIFIGIPAFAILLGVFAWGALGN